MLMADVTCQLPVSREVVSESVNIWHAVSGICSNQDDIEGVIYKVPMLEDAALTLFFNFFLRSGPIAVLSWPMRAQETVKLCGKRRSHKLEPRSRR